MTRLLYAHRGAAAEQPENTLPSFRRALEHGAHALEMDAHLTADGHVVVSHDPTGARMCGVAAEIRRSTLADVRAWDAGWGFLRAGERPFAGRGYRIPTLEEVVVEFPGVRLNVDLKQREPDMVEPTVRLLRRLGAEERVWLASFDARVLRRVRRLGWGGGTALARAEVAALLALPAPLLRLARLGDAAQLPTRVGRFSLARPWVLARCRALGLRVDFWTVNDPTEARALLALGADGLMTDDPAALAPLFRNPGTPSTR